MYEVYCDDKLIYSPNIVGLKIMAPKVDLELNKTGTFGFQIYPDHVYIGSLKKMKSIIKVLQDERILFRGRIIDDKSGFFNQRQVTCEGELAFLLDSIQRPYSYTGDVQPFLKQLLTSHNDQVDSEHQFILGNVTVTDPNGYINRSDSTFQNTFDAIKTKLLDTLGGYLQVRHEADGNYLDYLADFNLLSNQPIEFGKNLLDINKAVKGGQIATAIIPIGAKLEGSEERINIKSVNGGMDYVYNQDAVNQYGWIYKTQIWEDVTEPTNLLTKAREYLASTINLSNEIELSAVDLSGMNASFDSFHIGTYVPVKSGVHGIDQNFLVNKLSINLLDPKSNKLSLGTTFSSFTERTIESKKKQGEIVEVIEKVENNAKSYADQKSLAAETNAKAYADIKKSEATAAAKVYADAQVNLEKARADAYADGVLTDAEQYALSQAEAKRDEAKAYATTKATEAQNASKAYTDGQLNTFATTVNNSLGSLQDQIDGSITTWFYGVPPTTSNTPANTWTTTDIKNNHLGDLYYDTVTGYSYRWQVINNVYSWQRITDTDVTKALSDAAKAQDTADGKRRVFSSQPVPPYDINDLWVQGTSGDIMRCTVARTTGVYVASDWTKASKYTDDTAVNNLQIGGRNLIPGTNMGTNGFRYAKADGAGTVSEVDVLNVKGCMVTITTPSTSWKMILRTLDLSLIEKNTQYTLSFDILSTVNNSLSVAIMDANGTNNKASFASKSVIANTWYHYVATATTNSVENSNQCLYITGISEAGSYSFANLKLEKGGKATDWTPAPEDVENYTDTAINLLSQNLSSIIDQSSTDIRMEVSEKYYTKGEAAQLASNMSTEFTQTKNEFEFKFDQFSQSVDDLASGTGAQFTEISKYIRFIDGDIVLGESGSELVLKIQNDRISFMQNNVEVAYFSNRKLYVNDGEYINSLKIGNYAFVPRQNGNLSFKKVV